MNKESTQRLLALHYVYPKPLNRLMPLLKDDPALEFLHLRSPYDMAEQLQIPLPKATLLKQSYIHHMHSPFHAIYEKSRIHIVTCFDPLYPPSLLELIDPPAILYLKGDPQLLNAKEKIAIIGSRKAQNYSERAIKELLPPLLAEGFVIISGLAKGADAMAHRQTIDLGGKTIAVIGSGFLHRYPKVNEELFSLIEETHLLVSEYPPYMTPRKWNFPMRNRIISGLSKGVIVTQAEVKSGTLSTIEHALDHGKEVFAVPGDIFSPLSTGPHKLIAEGAKPVWNGAQVLEEYRQLRS
ncbi:DNA-processing protein DprA [Planococcus sp. ISL-109]|uniref:DNA-processing protein DprA n=1 Tax=Planococcus sp. ISL-109 TaxID=2819166 RepID=UPI001BE5AAD0|nr:DNA-processing protein DprA [Planococcus sp. ISL-109]MBT2581926.1 DNA-processing protein DprA [Planococcus sp. ISL-109]